MGLKAAHVEAGLRSLNSQMPEEINRVLTDQAYDVLLAPTELALTNLQVEGLSVRSHLVGNVMIDSRVNCRPQASPGAGLKSQSSLLRSARPISPQH